MGFTANIFSQKIDSTFGEFGLSVNNLSGIADKINGMALQEDSKLVVVGSSYIDRHHFPNYIILRFKNGVLDKNFNGNGKIVGKIGPGDNVLFAVTILRSGKILVAGYTFNGKDKDMILMRYDKNGNLDKSFAKGRTVVDLGPGDQEARCMTLLPNGKILIAGCSGLSNDYSFALLRFDSEGNIDTTFGNNGITTTNISQYWDRAEKMVIQSDGKIVLGGYSFVKTNTQLSLVLLPKGMYFYRVFTVKGLNKTGKILYLR